MTKRYGVARASARASVARMASLVALKSLATLIKAIILTLAHGACRFIITQFFITARSLTWRCNPLFRPMIVLTYIVLTILMVHRSV